MLFDRSKLPVRSPLAAQGVVSLSTAPFPQAEPAIEWPQDLGWGWFSAFLGPDLTHHQPSQRVCQDLCQAEHGLGPVLLWQSREMTLPAPSSCCSLSCLSFPSPVMLLCSAELVFPRDANVFYGMNSHVNFDFILRKKAELVGWGCPLHHPPSLWGILSEFPVGNVQLEQWAALAARALGCCICLEDTPWANSCLWEESPSCQYYTDLFYRTEPSSGYVCLNQLKTFCTCSTPENDPFWILFPKNFRMNELHLPLPWMGQTDTTFCVGWRS